MTTSPTSSHEYSDVFVLPKQIYIDIRFLLDINMVPVMTYVKNQETYKLLKEGFALYNERNIDSVEKYFPYITDREVYEYLIKEENRDAIMKLSPQTKFYKNINQLCTILHKRRVMMEKPHQMINFLINTYPVKFTEEKMKAIGKYIKQYLPYCTVGFICKDYDDINDTAISYCSEMYIYDMHRFFKNPTDRNKRIIEDGVFFKSGKTLSCPKCLTTESECGDYTDDEIFDRTSSLMSFICPFEYTEMEELSLDIKG